MTKIPKSVPRSIPRRVQLLAARIGHLFHLEKVLLFGSYAYGQPTPDSDVDFLVIMKTKLHPVEQAVAIRRVVNAPFPMDLLVRTPEQLEERLRLGDYFLQDIMRRGGLLYEAAHA